MLENDYIIFYKKMENNLNSILNRANNLANELFPPLYGENLEMQIIDVLTSELSEICKTEEEVKSALRNMFFAGQILNYKNNKQ